MLNAAHDLRNLYTVILGNCDLALEGAKPTSECIEIIRRCVERCRQITDDAVACSVTLPESRRTASEANTITGTLDLNAVAAEVSNALSGLESEGIAIALDLQIDVAAVPKCHGDMWELFRAVFNLTLNAQRAIELAHPTGEGKLCLGTGSSDDQVWLRVKDNGCGMSPEKLAQILQEPAPEADHGRGLAIVHSTCKKLGAEMLCETEEGVGSTFTICFQRQLGDPGTSQEASSRAVLENAR